MEDLGSSLLHVAMFFMLLPFHIRWMANHLAKRGFPHTTDLLHLCPGGKFKIFQRMGLNSITPTSATKFSSWLFKAVKEMSKEIESDSTDLSVLWLRSWGKIWKHRNDCVFNSTSPRAMGMLQSVTNECILWCSAGAKAFQELLVRSYARG